MVVFTIVSVALSIWATAIIVRHGAATTTQKVIYVALAWLLPILGAVIAFVGSLRFRERLVSDASQSMTESVAQKRQSMKH